MGDVELVQQGHELSVSDVVAQAAKIQDLMQKALKDGQHYGVIPGTKKPTLLKPGAEKINLLFRIGTGELEVVRNDMAGGHREITIKTPMVHLPTGRVIAYGVGSCSTMETKYRYREQKRICPICGAEAIIKGKQEYGGGWVCFKKKAGCGAKFKDGDEKIEGQTTGRVENEDIADVYNTVLKMASKRSYVDGTIKASAASDFFTQDVEDTLGHEFEEAIETTAEATPDQPQKEAENIILEREIGDSAKILGMDMVEAARQTLAEYRQEVKAGKLGHDEYIAKLKAFKDDLATKVLAKI